MLLIMQCTYCVVYILSYRGCDKVKVIRKISSEVAIKKLEKIASEKFVANETASSCLCRCSDG